MLSLHIRIVVCLIGLLFSIATVELVRRKHLRPEYALLWGALSVGILILAAFPQVIALLVSVSGMKYESAVTALVFLFAALMGMNYSVIISRQGNRIVQLTQEVALLRSEVEKLRAGAERNPKP